jgi:hypothetical protein
VIPLSVEVNTMWAMNVQKGHLAAVFMGSIRSFVVSSLDVALYAGGKKGQLQNC